MSPWAWMVVESTALALWCWCWIMVALAVLDVLVYIVKRIARG